jgi:hypothetical protein
LTGGANEPILQQRSIHVSVAVAENTAELFFYSPPLDGTFNNSTAANTNQDNAIQFI